MLKRVFNDPYLPAILITAVVGTGLMILGFALGYW